MQVNLVMFKDDDRRDFPVQGERTIIGRKLDCDLRIPTGDVSREHCEVLSNGSGLRVRDLESANGTYVNGKRVSESPLKAGDKLSVGPVVFVVQVDGEPKRITPHDVRVELENGASPTGGAGVKPEAPTKPIVAAKPSTPAMPSAPAKPAPSAKPAVPAKPAATSKPAPPTKPGTPGKAVGGAALGAAAAASAAKLPKAPEEEFALSEDDLFADAEEEFDMDAVEFLDDEDEEA